MLFRSVVLKRAQYFIITADNPRGLQLTRETTVRALVDPNIYAFGMEQLSLFDLPEAGLAPSIREATEEAILCLASRI